MQCSRPVLFGQQTLSKCSRPCGQFKTLSPRRHEQEFRALKRNLLRNASVISQFQWHRRSRFCSDRRATPHGSVPDTWVTVYSGDIGSYELGDIAVAGARDCTCGRTLPVIARIEGRTRNMFVFRDGTGSGRDGEWWSPCMPLCRSGNISWFSSITKQSSFATCRTAQDVSPISPD